MSDTKNLDFPIVADNVSIKIIASYGTGKFLAEFLLQAFGVVVFKFYEILIFPDAYG